MRVHNKTISRMILIPSLLLTTTYLAECEIRKFEREGKYISYSTKYLEITANNTEDSKEAFATVYGVTDLGKLQRMLEIPNHVDRFPVRVVGAKRSLFSITPNVIFSSKHLDKIYIPYTVETLFSDSVSTRNINELVLIPSEKREPEKIYHRSSLHTPSSTIVPPKYYDELLDREEYIPRSLTPANVVYYFNYEYAPNSNVYWIDLIGEDIKYNIYINPKPPKREGYIFRGWFMDEATTLKWDETLPSSTEEKLELYAGWTRYI